MYATPRFQDFRDRRVHAIPSVWNPDIAACDQLEALIADYVWEEAIIVSRMFKNLRGDPQCIWEFKTPDLRIFGWFVRRNHFVADEGWQADATKESNLYAGFANQTVHTRTTLDLDEPKHVTGDDPTYVLSNVRVENPRLPGRPRI